MSTERRAISENTLFSAGMVVILLGGAAWFTTMYVHVEASTQRIDVMETKQDKLGDDIHDMKTTLGVIAEQLKQINRKR